jgi:hypothetical protein
VFFSKAQRVYSPNSVLASGSCYKNKCGGFRHVQNRHSFLNFLGINASGLASSSIRLYGNGGQININVTGNGVYDLSAREATGVAAALSAQSNIIINYSYTPGSFNA